MAVTFSKQELMDLYNGDLGIDDENNNGEKKEPIDLLESNTKTIRYIDPNGPVDEEIIRMIKESKRKRMEEKQKQYTVKTKYTKEDRIKVEKDIIDFDSFGMDSKKEIKQDDIKEKKESPFTHIFNYMNGKINDITDEQVGGLDPAYLVSMFCGFDDFTVVLNEFFNNRINLQNISNAELIKFLKQAYSKFHMTNNFRNLFYVKKKKIDEEKEKEEMISLWRDKYMPHWHLDEAEYYIENTTHGQESFEVLVKSNSTDYEKVLKKVKKKSDKKTNKKKETKKVIEEKKIETIEKIEEDNQPNKEINNNENVDYKYDLINIPEEYYKKNLVDIQYMNNQLIYIFNNDGKKEYYRFDRENNYYYFTTNSNSLIVDRNICKRIDCNYNDMDRGKMHGTYLKDLPIEIRHSIDYYLQTDIEKQGKLDNIAYLDIEVYTKFDNKFPVPSEAEYPINAITIILNEKTYTWVYLDNDLFDYEKEKEKIINELGNEAEFYVFNDERELMLHFMKFIKNSEIMYIGGWNSHHFDIPYIYNRMKKLNIEPNQLSTFNHFRIYDKYDPELAGFVLVDMLILYKELTQNRKESYSLDYISNVELGEKKVTHEETLDELYRDDLIRFLRYNIQDVALLDKLSKKLDHIGLQNELRITTGSVWKFGVPSRLVDGIINMELIKQNKLPTTFYKRYKRRNIKGAFVSAPLPGIHDWLIDLDAASLYPSIIRSYNIGPNTYKAKICPKDAYYYLYDKDKLKDKIRIWLDPIYNCDLVKDMSEKEYNEFMMDDNWYNDKYNRYVKVISKEKFLSFMDEHIITLNGSIFCKHNKEKTIFYDILNMLKQSRSKYKKLQFKHENDNEIKLMQKYKNKQMSIKVIMNSIYGVMGSEFFRFTHQDLVESVTISGKEMIKMAGLEAENWILKQLDKEISKLRDDRFKEEWLADNQRMDTQYCIYTDTDSIMLELNDIIEHYTDEGKLIELEKNPEEKRNWFINYITDNIVPHIQNIVNDKAMNDLIKYHNGDIENHHYFEFKQEWIAKRAYFLNVKKQYALYLVANEGNLIDKMDYKGLEIERSDYPSITKKYLNEILTYILKTDNLDIDYVNTFKEEKRKEILKLIIQGNPTIARPASFSKRVEEYSTANKNGKYIGYPSQIYGMFLWNKTMYPYFEHGNKGYSFSIKSIDFNKINIKDDKVIDEISKMSDKEKNSIVLPPEESKLPEAFIIDKDKMIAFAWDDRMERLLSPLFENIESKVDESVIAFDI